MDDDMSPPFAALSKTDHGPIIIVTTFIMLIVSFLAVVVKLWTRMTTARKPVATDYVMIAAMALSFVQALVITNAANHGLGRRSIELDASDTVHLSKAFYAANILSIMTLAAAKSSVIMLMVSIQPRKAVLIGCYATIGTIVAWCIAGIFSLALQCQTSEPWVLGGQPNDSCVDQYALRSGLGAIDIVTDVAIVGLSYAMMHGVHVDWQRKSSVVALFALRILTPAFVICQLAAWRTYYTSDANERPWNAVAPSIWNQVVLGVSIITSCIPSIKKFLSEVQSGLMAVSISEQYEMTHSGGKGTHLRSNGSTAFDRSRGMSSRPGRSHLRSDEDDEAGYVSATDGPYHSRARIRGNVKDEHKGIETESVEGLTRNAIHQRVDVDVDFEESSDGGRPSR